MQLFENFIGDSPALRHIFQLLRQVAPADTTVLILGESGTGKEKVATAIHKLSQRKDDSFIKVNCAAMPHDLIESELFGHEKGAFTGAHEKKAGKFERADGGTIFLDEIGEMPLDLQVKLLRVLQEKEIERVGGGRPISVEVRVIAATSRNLEAMVGKGDFRLDLYYRLNVFPIHIPPLRSRSEDIPTLLKHFLAFYSAKHGKQVVDLSDQAVSRLVAYRWPGNVRELQNLVERNVLLANGKTITEVDLPELFPAPQESLEPKIKTFFEMEKEYILKILKKCNHRISGQGGAAKLLDMPASTLYSKIRKLGIEKQQNII